MQKAVLALTGDSDWAVRDQLGASLGELPAAAKTSAIVAFLERHGSDPVAIDAALSGVHGSEPVVLDALLRATDETPQRSAAITMLAATIVSGAQDAPVQTLFDIIAQRTRPVWQRAALLRGAEVTLLGAEAPGSTGGRGRGRGLAPGGDAPCPTCPGARGGPGGAPAFPVARGERQGAGAEGAPLRLSREPALASLASANEGDLSTRAAALIARVEWPGKPGGRAEAAPLSAADQARFDAGRSIYQNLCQPCHQPDGRGLEKVAPPLIGSEFALAAPTIPIRIVLNGKEGSVGLMPPLGAGLSDEQVAAVLTYIRREWGQDGSPVDVATVKQVRAMTADRTRPWKHDELMALIEGGRGRGRQ
jgi:mono/diheme cytochrome c family protein